VDTWQLPGHTETVALTQGNLDDNKCAAQVSSSGRGGKRTGNAEYVPRMRKRQKRLDILMKRVYNGFTVETPRRICHPEESFHTRRNPSSKQNECAARSRSLERSGQVVGVPDQWHQCVLAKSKASF